ncbi:hypothetical protein WG904_09665 [Pedobacter sp. Du54]|uniref:hypothetical protein n=1 Tax=Pedobacter anseongensis TaxID=3133439 RepID=UPI0030AFF1CF
MILKLQSIFFPYARHREAKQPKLVSKQDKINADRLVMLVLFALTIASAIILS